MIPQQPLYTLLRQSPHWCLEPQGQVVQKISFSFCENFTTVSWLLGAWDTTLCRAENANGTRWWGDLSSVSPELLLLCKPIWELYFTAMSLYRYSRTSLTVLRFPQTKCAYKFPHRDKKWKKIFQFIFREWFKI